MNGKRPRASRLIDDFAAGGRYHFTTAEMCSALGVSVAATRLALGRLIKKGLIASPCRGFYVIIPPEYRRIRCLPADQFIPDLMKHRKQLYYVALLSAAQYHGAAHHSPQEFQVAVAGNHRSIFCGAVRVSFIARRRIAEVPVQSFNTPRGTILVSSIEATAFDLMGYVHRAAGLDNVATVLSELAEHIDPILLCKAAETAPIPWAQRLGYLLELVDAADKASALKLYVRRRVRDVTPLIPAAPKKHTDRVNDWRLLINAEVELEI